MDAQPNLARQVWDRLRSRFSRKAVVAIGIIALLGICDTAIAHSMPSPYAPISPTATPLKAVARARVSHVARQITPVTGQPTTTPTAAANMVATPTVTSAQNGDAQTTPAVATQSAASVGATAPVAATPKPKPRPKRKATPLPTGEQTPLHLTDPTTNDALAGDTPWWQSLLDVTWKLALVVALIYLVARALTAFKGKGFAPGKGLIPRPGKTSSHFMEQIEEIQLAPNHVLHAVRVGERVMLIARTNGTLRALGEAEIANEEGNADVPALPAGTFTGQLMRAWAGLIPSGAVKEDPAPQAVDVGKEPTGENADDAGDEAVIDAKWSHLQADATPEDASLPDLPLRKGMARPSDAPEPLTPEQEREILWFAEANGDGAAAKKFGLTRQRVTAMRVRHDRLREDRARDKRPSVARPTVPDAIHTPESPAKPRLAPRPALPDLPRHNPATEPTLPAAARGSLARSAYRQSNPALAPKPAAPVQPDVAAAPKPAEDPNDAQSITVGQILAARFGIKIPPTN